MSFASSSLPSFETETLERLVLSVGVIVCIGAVRFLAERLWVGRVQGGERHRRRVGMRVALNGLLAVALLALWISQLQTVVLSLAAVMVALVIATKELIMCAAGAVLRVGGHLFRVGDRISVRGLHGEVIDHGLFSTTLLELSHAGAGHRGTGRTFVLPNSAFLTEAVRIEAGPRRYAPHRFALTLEHQMRPSEALRELRRMSEEACAGDRERAARFHSMAALRTGSEDEGPEPRVRVRTSELGKLVFEVSIYCLVEEADALEATIATEWLDCFATPAPAASVAASPVREADAHDLAGSDAHVPRADERAERIRRELRPVAERMRSAA